MPLRKSKKKKKKRAFWYSKWERCKIKGFTDFKDWEGREAYRRRGEKNQRVKRKKIWKGNGKKEKEWIKKLLRANKKIE